MSTFKLEKQYGENLKTHYTNCIGIDEVGRGCLAGPVVACACIIKNDIEVSILHKIKDSKKITPKKRKIIAQEILPHVFYGFGIVDNDIIDKINILQASLLAMKLHMVIYAM